MFLVQSEQSLAILRLFGCQPASQLQSLQAALQVRKRIEPQTSHLGPALRRLLHFHGLVDGTHPELLNLGPAASLPQQGLQGSQTLLAARVHFQGLPEESFSTGWIFQGFARQTTGLQQHAQTCIGIGSQHRPVFQHMHKVRGIAQTPVDALKGRPGIGILRIHLHHARQKLAGLALASWSIDVKLPQLQTGRMQDIIGQSDPCSLQVEHPSECLSSLIGSAQNQRQMAHLGQGEQMLRLLLQDSLVVQQGHGRIIQFFFPQPGQFGPKRHNSTDVLLGGGLLQNLQGAGQGLGRSGRSVPHSLNPGLKDQGLQAIRIPRQSSIQMLSRLLLIFKSIEVNASHAGMTSGDCSILFKPMSQAQP